MRLGHGEEMGSVSPAKRPTRLTHTSGRKTLDTWKVTRSRWGLKYRPSASPLQYFTLKGPLKYEARLISFVPTPNPGKLSLVLFCPDQFFNVIFLYYWCLGCGIGGLYKENIKWINNNYCCNFLLSSVLQNSRLDTYNRFCERLDICFC